MSKMNGLIIAVYRKGYRVTREGNVLGLKKKTLSNKTINKNGYHYFSFRFNGKREIVMTHRLQAYQKFGNTLFSKYKVVRHKDGNCLNNSWDNILIGTQSENMLDIPKNTRVKRALHASSFLTKYNKDEIREFHQKHKSYKKTMKRFEITSKGALHYVLNS